jgi:hypothetical protein
LADIQGVTSSEKEDKLLKAVSKTSAVEEEEEIEEEEDHPKKRKILDVVKGFLPRKKERPSTKAEQSASDEKKKIPSVKTVTPIQSKKPKKK